MYAHLSLFEKKNYDTKRSTFPNFLNDPLQFIVILHWLQQLFGKKSISTVFVRFLKKTVNFTRSCAFAQKAKFYALKMLKKQNLMNPKAAKLATLQVIMHTFFTVICTLSLANIFYLLYINQLPSHYS